MSPIEISPRLFSVIVYATIGLSALFGGIAWIAFDEGAIAAIKAFCISVIFVQFVLWLIVFFWPKRHPNSKH